MVLIRKKDVPDYLHDSDLYRSLAGDEDDEEQFDIPEADLRTSTELNNETDLRHLLSTLRYWGVVDIPIFMISSIIDGLPCDGPAIVVDFGMEMQYLAALFTIHNAETIEQKLTSAVKSGEVTIVKFVFEHENIESRDAKVLSWRSLTCQLCALAAGTGSLKVLQYLHETLKFAWNVTTADAAAGNGHLEVLQYVHKQGGVWTAETCAAAAKGGHLDCLIYAHSNGCRWDGRTCSYAVEGNHFDCLMYAHRNGCELHHSACTAAATVGSLESLQYLHQRGCDWGVAVTNAAARQGHLACLQYAHEQGCEWHASCCSYAAENGHLACLRYAHEQGCAWNRNTCTFAAAGGHLACLQYAHSQGCPWDERTTQAAAVWRHYDCLQYAVDHNCPCDETRRAVYDLHCAGRPRMVDKGIQAGEGEEE